MVIDGLGGNVQPARKLGIGMSLHQQRQNLHLARRQSRRILAR